MTKRLHLETPKSMMDRHADHILFRASVTKRCVVVLDKAAIMRDTDYAETWYGVAQGNSRRSRAPFTLSANNAIQRAAVPHIVCVFIML
jgi:hypothetical protein